MSRRKKHEEAEDLEAWLMTYADMITLLLCFFAIIIAVSEPKQSKFEEMKEGMMSEFTDQVVETPFTDVFDAFNSIVSEQQLEQDVTVMETDEGIVIELSSSAFFEPGVATIKKEAIPIIEAIALELVGFDFDKYHIEVEGHTDDVPIHTPQYDSNWELAANRATNIVKLFAAQGVEANRMRALSYGDTQPKVPNLDLYGEPIEENRALNRRIAIKLEKGEFD